MRKNSGFTLAEVLITLAIIGVVAAMTVPALMTSTRGKEYEVGANKALSTISNAITMRIAMEGVAPSNFTGTMGQYFAIPPGQYAGSIRTGEQPALPAIFLGANGTEVKIDANQSGSGVGSTVSSITLKDNMIVGNMDYKGTGGTANNCGDFKDGCMINIDTNGTKGPTRTLPGTNPACASGEGTACDNNGAANASGGSNASPDVIQLRIRDSVVEAANQRTKNILGSGNATIDK